jgi:hypothetical protein
VGSMDRPVWWDEETTAVVTHTVPVIKYAVKQYFYKIGKIAYLKIFTASLR